MSRQPLEKVQSAKPLLILQLWLERNSAGVNKQICFFFLLKTIATLNPQNGISNEQTLSQLNMGRGCTGVGIALKSFESLCWIWPGQWEHWKTFRTIISRPTCSLGLSHSASRGHHKVITHKMPLSLFERQFPECFWLWKWLPIPGLIADRRPHINSPTVQMKTVVLLA